jgi:hypothetical protein
LASTSGGFRVSDSLNQQKKAVFVTHSLLQEKDKTGVNEQKTYVVKGHPSIAGPPMGEQ